MTETDDIFLVQRLQIKMGIAKRHQERLEEIIAGWRRDHMYVLLCLVVGMQQWFHSKTCHMSTYFALAMLMMTNYLCLCLNLHHMYMNDSCSLSITKSVWRYPLLLHMSIVLLGPGFVSLLPLVTQWVLIDVVLSVTLTSYLVHVMLLAHYHYQRRCMINQHYELNEEYQEMMEWIALIEKICAQ